MKHRIPPWYVWTIGILLSMLLLGALPSLHRPPVALAAGTITGTAFQDYNADGLFNTTASAALPAVDRGVGSVTVTAFDASGAQVGTATTAADGTYTLNHTGTGTIRVEFSTLPPGYQPGAYGSSNGTSVQFVAANATEVNFGVNKPSEYCENNPTLAANCYVVGDQINGANRNDHVLVGFPYTSSGTTSPPLFLGDARQIGTTWGLAYRRSNRSLYSAAFMKRHSGFGPSGPGGIYRTGPITVTSGIVIPNPLVIIPNAGGDPHPVSDINCSSIDGVPGGSPPMVQLAGTLIGSHSTRSASEG